MLVAPVFFSNSSIIFTIESILIFILTGYLYSLSEKRKTFNQNYNERLKEIKHPKKTSPSNIISSYCPLCQTKTEQSDKFCMICGFKLKS